MGIDDYFKHEGHECVNTMDTIILDECHAKMAKLWEEFEQLYYDVERIVEHDEAIRDSSRRYLWAV